MTPGGVGATASTCPIRATQPRLVFAETIAVLAGADRYPG